MPNISLNGNTAKKLFFNGNAVKKLFLNGNQIWQDAVLPVGIIIGYTGLTAPSGWSLFSSANDKLIVGAGNSYKVNTTGGSNSVSKALATTTAGAHTGTGFTSIGASGSIALGGNATAGGHSHTLAVVGTLNPYRHQIGLIKALVETNMPIGGIIFSASNISADIDAINVNTTSAFLSSNDSNRTLIGSDTLTLTGDTDTKGEHTHGTRDNGGGISSSGYLSVSAGSHTHIVNISVVPQIKAKYLTAWSNALSEVSICPNVIGMWESSVVPDGWAICDGTNGTPDLRDYFIRLGDVSTAGNVYNSGGNTTIPATSVPSGGSHQHKSKKTSGYGTLTVYHSDAVTHVHTTVANTVSIVPTYYALTFIMKL